VRLTVDGFRSIRHVEVELREGLNLLIGPNGAGKSNLLSALRLVRAVHEGGLSTFVAQAGGADALLHYGSKVSPSLMLGLAFRQRDGKNWYRARLEAADDDSMFFAEEMYGYQPPGDEASSRFSLGPGHRETLLNEEAKKPVAKTARAVKHCLAQTRFYHFHDTSPSAPLRRSSRGDDDASTLKSDGSNLALLLYRLSQSEDEEEQRALVTIHDAVRRVAPFIRELRPTLLVGAPRFGPPPAVRLSWVDERGELFGPHQLSDGTLRAIALFTALAQPRRPDFISVDEPELGLHPVALEVLMELARGAARTSQVLMSTQSTALLDYFVPEEVLVAERQDSASTFTRHSEESLGEWLSEYTLSELYNKNLLGGRP
jgi:predicted ATPase